MNTTLNLSYLAGAAILGNRLVMLSADDTVIAATADTDAVIGVVDANGAASGDRVDVLVSGVAEVKLGGTVTRGALVASDAAGVGVSTSTAGKRVAGIALESGVSGDVIRVLLKQGAV